MEQNSKTKDMFLKYLSLIILKHLAIVSDFYLKSKVIDHAKITFDFIGSKIIR